MRSRSNSLRPAAPDGFTLMEVLTAMALASVLLLGMATLLGRSSTLFGATRASVSSLADSRALLQFLEAELSSRLPDSPLLWDTTELGNDRLGIIRICPFDEVTTAARGDLAASVYYVAFTRDRPGVVSPKLFRHHLDAAGTQPLLETPGPWTMPELDPANDEPLLYNVIRFKARPLQLNSRGQYESWHTDSDLPPAAVEILVEITDDTTAARFPTQAAWLALRDPQQNPSQPPPFIRQIKQTVALHP